MANGYDIARDYARGNLSGWMETRAPGIAGAEFSRLSGNFISPRIVGRVKEPPRKMFLFQLVRKVLGRDVENIPQEIGDCFVASTMVRMADGSEKEIQDVNVGDVVLSHLGNPRRVLRTIKKPYSGELVTVRGKGCPRGVTATPDHRFVRPVVPLKATQNAEFAWVPIGELDSYDKVLIPHVVAEESQEKVYDLAEYVDSSWHVTDETVRPNNSLGHEVKRWVKLDSRLGLLLGLYLAEGGISTKDRPSKVQLSFGSHEKLLHAEAKGLFEEVFGVKVSVRTPPNHQSVTLVECNSVAVARFFNELVSGNVYTKRVPPAVMASAKSVRLAVLKGWYDGDGHCRVNEVNGGFSCVLVGVSASRGLRQDMYHLALSCGLKPNHNLRKKAKHQRVASGNVTMYGENALSLYPEHRSAAEASGKRKPWTSRTDMTTLGLAVNVAESSREQVENIHVYCLEVEEDHSFVANGYACSNCVSWACRNTIDYLTCVQIALKGAKEQYRPLFPPYFYGTGRVYVGNGQLGNEDGSLGAWMAEAAMKYGGVFADETGVPKYSGRVAKAWGDPNPGPDLDKWKDFGQKHLVKSAAPVRTWDELVEAISNGYPIEVCSDQGFQMEPGPDGFHAPEGKWGHAMCITSYGMDPEPYALVRNSWGDVMGRLKDFDSDIEIPVGYLRVRRKVIERMLAQEDSFAYSNFEAMLGQEIPEHLFLLV